MAEAQNDAYPTALTSREIKRNRQTKKYKLLC